jgi:hypothetical protein
MDATEIGTQAGGFLGGLLNPVLGNTTETTVTKKPAASSSITTVIAIVAVVSVLAVVGFIVFNKSSN